MEFKKFEQQIAETLSSDELGLDIQELINDIHGKKKKRRGIFIFLWAAIGVMLISGGMVLTGMAFNKYNKSESELTSIAKSEPKAIASKEIYTAEAQKNEGSGNLVLSAKQLNKNYNNINVAASKINISDTKQAQKNNTSTSHIEEYVIKEQQESHEFIKVNALNHFEQRINHTIPFLTKINHFSSVFYQNHLPKINSDKIVCPTFSNKSKLLLEIIPEAGAFIPLKKLVNSNLESNKVFELRNNTEKSLEGINAGLYLKLSKEKAPFYIKAGISWSRLTEKMPLSYSYSRKDTTQGIISVTVSQTGDTITYIYGDIIQDRKISGNKTRHYSISMLDIPISAGVEKRYGRWSAGVEGGLVFNVSMKSSGSILASDTSFVNLDISSNHFKSSLGLSYFGGIHIGRDFHKAGRLFLAARARYIPESFSSDQNRIRQTYHFIGLNLGYVYTF